MVRGATSFILLALISLGVIAATRAWTLEFGRAKNKEGLRRWFRRWALKGVAVPCVLWLFFNAGLFARLVPLMPQVQLGAYLGNRWPAYLGLGGAGIFVITTYWAAMTLAWVLLRTRRELPQELRSDFRSLLLTSVAGMALFAAIILFAGGWLALGVAVITLLAPAAWHAPSLVLPPKTPPIYARAVARMKFGKYPEAEWEIIKQLEQCEDDYQGWIMLAELYAVHFRDLREAEQTILELCDEPKVNASQLSVALHKLADWHLSIGNDPDAARRALQMVEERCRGTHLAHMAGLRRRQLPLTLDDLREQRQALPVPLPALGDKLEEESAGANDPAAVRNAKDVSRNLQARLKLEPDNYGLRERYARTLAEQLGQAEAGIGQLQMLLGVEEAPGQKRAEWLSMMAAWEYKYRKDEARSVELLEELVREHPETVQAFAARMRLERLKREGSLERAKKAGERLPP